MSIIDDYKKLNKGFNDVKTIKPYQPVPTQKNYEDGFLKRYFVQKSNDINAPIFEINQSNYAKLSPIADYSLVVLKWRISGSIDPVYDDVGNILDFGVRESNKKTLEFYKEKIPGLKYRITNYLQFYKK
jgi:hypothetical protein